MGYLDYNGLARFYAGLKSKFVRSVNGYVPDSNGNIVLPEIEASGRQAFSYTVDPSDWVAVDSGEWYTDPINASQAGISSLALTNKITSLNVIDEDTGSNPATGYHWKVQCWQHTNNLSDPTPDQLKFFYGGGNDSAPASPMTFSGYIEETLASGPDVNTGIFVTGLDSGYPVGSFYHSSYPTDPAMLFGGTWERIVGRTLLGATDDVDISGDANAVAASAGTKGGYKDAIVVSHSHQAQAINGDSGAFMTYNAGKVDTGLGETRVTAASSGSLYVPRVSNANVDFARQNNTASTGVSGTGRNVSPYLAVYIWHRVG